MYTIVTYPDPVLRTRADEVKNIDGEIHEIIDKMIETMYVEDGVGLAANQVGLAKRIIVLDAGDGPVALIDPILTVPENAVLDPMEEGCLSLPNIRIEIARPDRVYLQALDPSGKPVEMLAEGLFAKVLQHETDHINGILIIDHVSSIQRTLLRPKLRKLEKHNTGA